MTVFVQNFARKGRRVLAYLNDFLIASSPPRVIASTLDWKKASAIIPWFITSQIKENYSEWRMTRFHYSGALGNRDRQCLDAFPCNVTQGEQGQVPRIGHASTSPLGSKLCVWYCYRTFLWRLLFLLLLEVPWAWSYIRSLYWNMASNRKRGPRGHVRLSHKSLSDLVSWKIISDTELAGRPIQPIP